MLRKAAADCGVDPRAVTVSVVALDGLRMPEGGRMPVVRPLLLYKHKRPNLKVQPECYIELLFFYY